MQVIELTPMTADKVLAIGSDLDYTVADVVETNEDQRRITPANSLASFSRMDSAASNNQREESEMLISTLVDEAISRDCDTGIPGISLQLNKNNQPRASPRCLEQNVDQDDESEELKQEFLMESKTMGRKRCNNASHFRRFTSTS